MKPDGQPDFPTVPFRLALPGGGQRIERLTGGGVRTIQLRIKDKRDEEVEADAGRRYRAGASLRTPRLLVNDYRRLAILSIALRRIWVRKIRKPLT